MMVDEKLWAEQEGHTWANQFLIKNKFDLVVSGDNHKTFFASKGSQHLVNIGAMMRSSIAQIDHHPVVAVYSTTKQTVDIIDMDVADINAVMCVDKAKKEKERNSNLEKFVSSVKGTVSNEHVAKLNFVDALNAKIKDAEIEQPVADIINECLDEY